MTLQKKACRDVLLNAITCGLKEHVCGRCSWLDAAANEMALQMMMALEKNSAAAENGAAKDNATNDCTSVI
jgi:hypothetical protein